MAVEIPVKISKEGSLYRLDCPGCKNGLSHEMVEVFHRDAEDSATGQYFAVTEAGKIIASDNMDDCPSERRGGVRISFSCDCCFEHWLLELDQNRGWTYLRMNKITPTEET